MIIVISLLFALELSVNISNNFDYELSVYISKKIQIVLITTKRF